MCMAFEIGARQYECVYTRIRCNIISNTLLSLSSWPSSSSSTVYIVICGAYKLKLPIQIFYAAVMSVCTFYQCSKEYESIVDDAALAFTCTVRIQLFAAYNHTIQFVSRALRFLWSFFFVHHLARLLYTARICCSSYSVLFSVGRL